MMRQTFTWQLPRTTLELGPRTRLMAILNVTPDSFSDGGFFVDPELAVERAFQLEQAGADILDIGGESTRPGSQSVSEEEEIRRVLPVVERLAKSLRIPISVDTYRAGVADRALDGGAQVVNDISAFRFDPGLAGVCAKHHAGVVLMHSRGDRSSLHLQPPMDDPVSEVRSRLMAAAAGAVDAGIAAQGIVLDPGIGFGKDRQASLAVLARAEVLSDVGFPVLIGPSRKSFLTPPGLASLSATEDRSWATAAAVTAAILKGAHLVRVHDVAEMRAVSDVADRILAASTFP